MKLVEWSMEGEEVANCNCNWGCPCQFNGDPSHGDCRAFTFVQINKGRFGDVPLDGLRWGILMAWPSAVHLGNGTCQTIIDERANPQQRAAIEAISHGRETEPGKLIWQVFSTTMTKVLPTLFAPIELTIDLPARKASVAVAGLVQGEAAPIPNPVTSAGHEIRVVLPNGFEFSEAEFVNGKGKASGSIALEFNDTHAHLARVHWSTHGVVR